MSHKKKKNERRKARKKKIEQKEDKYFINAILSEILSEELDSIYENGDGSVEYNFVARDDTDNEPEEDMLFNAIFNAIETVAPGFVDNHCPCCGRELSEEEKAIFNKN